MDLNTLGEPDRIPWRIHRCFHNPPYIRVETMGNLLRKHACINVPNIPCMAVHHFQQLDYKRDRSLRMFSTGAVVNHRKHC